MPDQEVDDQGDEEVGGPVAGRHHVLHQVLQLEVVIFFNSSLRFITSFTEIVKAFSKYD